MATNEKTILLFDLLHTGHHLYYISLFVQVFREKGCMWFNGFEALRIYRDVWIGADATILKGVTAGPRSIVAAKAVVTKDVPPDVIVAGVPAKVVATVSQAPQELMGISKHGKGRVS